MHVRTTCCYKLRTRKLTCTNSTTLHSYVKLATLNLIARLDEINLYSYVATIAKVDTNYQLSFLIMWIGCGGYFSILMIFSYLKF